MEINKGPSIYFLTDKNIHDALKSKRVTLQGLREILIERNVLFSAKDDKETLISYFVKNIHDYFDYKRIVEMLENKNRKEPFTNSVVQSTVKKDQITKICAGLKLASSTRGESVSINVKGTTVTISTSYVDTNYNKTELQQRTTKKAVVEIDIDEKNGTLLLRRQANEKSKGIAKELLQRIKENTSEEIAEEQITLETISSPQARSEFFIELIQNISKYSLFDVLNVSVDIKHSVGQTIAGTINKATLNGKDVLQSSQFKQMHDDGFYITKIIWLSEFIEKDHTVEFFAQFDTPETCTNFKYLVRAIYDKKVSGEYKVTSRQPEPSERTDLTRALEAASRTAMEKISAKYGN
ncbi:MAG: hypothetical protein CL578_01345 [Alteromonadaceae bacterium]|jgi:hypothetical protein|uniref:hypothetical protein n=1 Tax=Paraglaciecola chathamensis TaxID=368405 RepID=UPI000C535688|nr:hypothetical protein [Paraglaciecola agarilytica]MBN23679.1 hypothetical protein [Alteromonadaceae bacterium]|tara:strand:+ start:6325 stop:7380 length:1056 start_codon:yes stop_codon:yes gene_type:complete